LDLGFAGNQNAKSFYSIRSDEVGNVSSWLEADTVDQKGDVRLFITVGAPLTKTTIVS
jgi:hypothetical protein